MNTDTYYIPVNFTNAGRILGLFEIRNLIEALLLCLPVLYVCLTYLLPWDLVNIAALKAFPDSVWMSFGYSVLLFGILSLGCIVLSRRLLARRMENEHVA